MLIKSSPMRCNLSSAGPQLGSSHAHWHEVNPTRARIISPDERAAHFAALNRIQREQDKRFQRALANGAKVLREVKS